MSEEKRRVAVIGGGAAGMLAASTAAEAGAAVTLFEKNEKLGRKLGITGKGRCNVTSDSDLPTVLANIPTNPRFLYSALHAFGTADTIRFFTSAGVPLKTERGNRVFPVSDRAADIVNALRKRLGDTGVTILRQGVAELWLGEDRSLRGVRLTDGRTLPFDRVIVATGGMSYPLTGSTGDGYRFAESVGHTVIPPVPSLVPLETEEAWCRTLTGLSLKNVALHVEDMQTGERVFSDFGEMLFTHFGMSGPMVLSASAHLKQRPLSRYRIVLDLKPALDDKTLDARILRDFAEQQNRSLENALCKLLPGRLIAAVIAQSGISPQQKVNRITREERAALLHTLKHLVCTVRGFRPIAEAIVTSGGVSVREVSPKTMESKLCPGLYFAGEVLDVDAYTGGFNLQIAFSTGYAAGSAAADSV